MHVALAKCHRREKHKAWALALSRTLHSASENPWPPVRVAGVSGSDSTTPGGATTRRRKQEVAEGGNRKWLLEALGIAAQYATAPLRGL